MRCLSTLLFLSIPYLTHAGITCLDGETSLDGISCIPCPLDSFCQAGLSTSCPAHSTSPASASLISQCDCEDGYFRTNLYQCLLCPFGSKCYNNQLVACPPGSFSSAGSTVCTLCSAGTFQTYAGSSDCQTCPGGLNVLKSTEFNEFFDPTVNRTTVPGGVNNLYILRSFLTQSQDSYLTKWSFFAEKPGCVVTPMIFGATVSSIGYDGSVQYFLRHIGTTRTTAVAGLQNFKFSDTADYYVRNAVPTGTQYLFEFEFFAWSFSGPSCIPYDLADINMHSYSMEFPEDIEAAYYVSEPTNSAPRYWSVQMTFEHRAMVPSTVGEGTSSIYQCACPTNSRQLSDGNCQGLCENGKYMLHDTDQSCSTCLQGSKCSGSVITACQAGYSSLRGSSVCSPCPGPGTHTNIALYMCGLLTTCTAGTPQRLGTSSWFGLGTVNVGVGGINSFPSTAWFPGAPVVGLILNAAADRPYALLQRAVTTAAGVPIAFQFRYMCTGASCSTGFKVQWSYPGGPLNTIFSAQSVPYSTMVAASWVQTSTDFIIPNATQVNVRVVAEMVTSSAAVWLASFEAVSLGQWQYGNLARLRLLDTTNIAVSHFTGYSEQVESSTLSLADTTFSQPVVGPVYAGYPYMVSVWAYGAGTLKIRSSVNDSQTWTTTQTMTQYSIQTTVSPLEIGFEITGTVVISSPSVSLRTLDIGCQSCLIDHWCSNQYVFECPQNSLSVAGSSLQSDCWCKAGYYGSVTSLVGWTPCSLCETNYFCTGGNHLQLCPDGTKSNPGASQCTPCDAGEICKGGKIGSCPIHSHGPPNASDVTECICDDGYYGNSTNCMRCLPGSYCYAGKQYACTEFATSTSGAVNSTECFCSRGHYGLHNEPCVACEEGSWCWTGIKNACPANMWSPVLSSFPGNCTCEYGYSLSGASCIPCSGGTYKTTRGFDTCSLCTAGTFSAAIAATSNMTCAVCDVGTFAAVSGQVQCQPCSAGYHTPVLGSVACMPCWQGSYSLGGVATCTGCSAGSMSAEVAAQSSSVCSACPVGSWSPGNTSRCNICGACSYWNFPRMYSFLVDSMVSVFDRADSRIRFAVHPVNGKVFMASATSVFVVDMTAKTLGQEIVVQGPGKVWWYACLAASQLGNYLYAIQSTYVFRVDLDMNAQWDLVYPSSSATCVVEDVTLSATPLLWIAQLDGVRSMSPEQALVVNSYPVTGSNYICLSPTDPVNLYVTGTFGLKKVNKATGAQTSLLSGAAYTVCSFTPDGMFLIMSNAATKSAWAYSTFDGAITKILNNAAVSGILTDSTNIVLGVDTVGVRNISYSEKDSNTCSPGKFSEYSGLQLESECKVCPIGSLCPGGSNITQCVPGTYSSAVGLREQRQCSVCPQGYFCVGGGAIQMCPLGSYSLITGVSSVADCAPCAAGYFCPNTTARIKCPDNTMTPARASDLGECKCAAGYSCKIIIVVHAEILLPLLRTEFTVEMQNRYILAIAMAAGVDPQSVHIISISEVIMGAGRRLLGYNANAVEVHTSIYDSVSRGVSDLNAHLKSNGLPAHRGIRISIHNEVVSSFKL